ncbi:MAG: hypothetical protein HYT66_00105 [Candidatus Yanofskybacteria bacterium]|nr:hypothetical protein [Candidatus Yanofskybacteria bacterium]MBI4134726.1 hypothetical protein [Candidatus Sungbacteria bacterium]
MLGGQLSWPEEEKVETAIVFRGVATPRPLLPDEISALVVLERIQSSPISEIRFHDRSECSPEQIDEFLAQGLFPVELGDMSYKTIDVGSATEAVIVNLGLNPTEMSSGVSKLIELMARRNQSGYLNQNHMSVPRILGNLYDLGYDEMDLIDRFKDVVQAFIDDKDRKAESRAPARDDTTMESELPELVQVTKKCQFASFTPGRYLRDLWRRGDPVDQIREKVSFWIDAWDRFQKEYANARTEWAEMGKINFCVLGLSGAAVETNNRFIAKVAAPTVDIFINRRFDGHGAVMTLGRDMSALAEELEQLEPGRWYYHRPAGHLINGGSSPASELSLDRLIELVKENHPPIEISKSK